MFKRLGILAGNLFLGGCAVTHSDRPDSTVPIVKPIWHTSDVRVADTPVVHDNVVYAAARPWSEDKKHLYAFDLQTGKQLWRTEFAVAHLDFFAGPVLSLTDADGASHILIAKTGKDVPVASPATPPSLLIDGTYVDKILYAMAKDNTLQAMDSPTHTLWTAKVPMNVPFPPVVSGATVYAYGRIQAEHGVEQGCGVYAFDKTSGALRWSWETKDTPISFLTADADTAYISLQAQDKGSVIAFDAATGRQRWTHPTARYFWEAPVLLDSNSVVVRDETDRLAKSGYLLRGLNAKTGDKLWESKTSWKYDRWVNYEGQMLVADGKPHATLNEGGATSPDSWLTAVDIRTGKELWRSEVAQLAMFTLPAAGNGVVVIGSEPFDSASREVSGLWAWSTKR